MMMNKITEMVEKMHEEAEEAQEYALLAEQHKADDRELSEIAKESETLLSRRTLLSRHPWVEDVTKELAEAEETEKGGK